MMVSRILEFSDQNIAQLSRKTETMYKCNSKQQLISFKEVKQYNQITIAE